jgi:hypothetical protein
VGSNPTSSASLLSASLHKCGLAVFIVIKMLYNVFAAAKIVLFEPRLNYSNGVPDANSPLSISGKACHSRQAD